MAWLDPCRAFVPPLAAAVLTAGTGRKFEDAPLLVQAAGAELVHCLERVRAQDSRLLVADRLRAEPTLASVALALESDGTRASVPLTRAALRHMDDLRWEDIRPEAASDALRAVAAATAACVAGQLR